MTKTVFLSGSRKLSRLNDVIRRRLDKMMTQGLRIIVGDASGADKALQSYLAEAHYEHVVVYCAGDVCRNNVGNWLVENIKAGLKLKGRDFYTAKDKVMASKADFGLVLWDGKSTGSISNVLELMYSGKKVAVYFSPEKKFHDLGRASDIETLLQLCERSDYRAMNDKIHVGRRLENLRAAQQGALNL